MTVVFLSHSAVASGAELSLLRSIRHLPSPAEAIVVFAEDGPLVSRMEEAGATVMVVPMTTGKNEVRRGVGLARQLRAGLGLLGYARRLRPVLRQAGATVVVGRSLRAVIYGRLATWGLKCRFVWSIHDHLTTAYLGRAALLYSRLMPRLVDAVIVNSRSTLATVAVPSRLPVLVLPPGLELDDQQPGPVTTPLQKVVVLGRLSPWKGQDVAIKAFAASRLSTSATLDIIGAPLFGEDLYAQSLRTVAEESGVSERVRFVGHVDDPAELLHEADVLMHTSVIPEPFGAVVIEGMNAGCLVIATAPGGPAESIDDGRSGLLVAAGSVAAMTRAINQLTEMSPEECSHMTSAARTTAQGFDAAKLSEELFSWLAEVGTGAVDAQLTVSSSLR